MWLLGTVIVGIIAYGLYLNWYNSTDHWHKDNGIAELDENAPIVDVEETQVGRFWRNPKVRTSVHFEDGFRYVSHKCCIKDFVVFSKITMTDELREEILSDAREAHKTEIALRDGTLK